MKIKKWRVIVNVAWTKEIVFDKSYFIKSSANKKLEELKSKYSNDKTKVITFCKN